MQATGVNRNAEPLSKIRAIIQVVSFLIYVPLVQLLLTVQKWLVHIGLKRAYNCKYANDILISQLRIGFYARKRKRDIGRII